MQNRAIAQERAGGSAYAAPACPPKEIEMTETQTFVCSICGQESRDICVACTKDCCENHRCLRCSCCSDCCLCEMTRTVN